MRIVSARRRTSTVSSATRRWPRTIEVQRAFALSDPALADDEDAEAENVEQHAMQQLAHDEAVLENGGDLRNGDRRRHQRAEHRKVAALRLEDDFAEHPKAAGDQNARHFVVLAHLAHRVGAIGGIQAFEIADLAVAEHQDASLHGDIRGSPRARGRFSACRDSGCGGRGRRCRREFRDRGPAFQGGSEAVCRPSRRRAMAPDAALMPAYAIVARAPTPQAASCAPTRQSAFAPATCLLRFRPAAALS